MIRQVSPVSALCAALYLMTPTAALSQSSTPERGEPVLLPSTYEHRLQSLITGREFVLWVAVPPSYGIDPEATSTRYPTLYLLDGRQSLQLALPMLRLTNRGQSGDVIMVGVGYPLDARGLPSCGEVLCRDVDYIPPPYGSPDSTAGDGRPRASRSGGAATFLRVLEEEIIPFVEARYRASEDRGLFGYSQGGLFATYALFEAPDLFTRYAAASPAISWDVEGMLQRERDFRERSPILRKLVYFSVGAAEAPYLISDTWRMVGALCDGMFSGRRYQGLTLLTAIISEEDHRSALHIARALAALYPPDSVDGPVLPIRDMATHCRAR